MRIGVDASCWANERGYGRFTRELVAAMVASSPDDEFVLYCDDACARRIRIGAPNVGIESVPCSRPPTEAASASGRRSLFDVRRFTRAVRRRRPDVLFYPSVYTWFPPPRRLRTVVTIHDAIAERFPSLTHPDPRARFFWKLKVRLAIRAARLVLTVSEYAARDLERVLRIPAARIRVAVEAPSDAYRPTGDAGAVARVSAHAGVPSRSPYFVYVGGFNPHKLVDVLVRALARASDGRDPAPHLVLVGPVESDVFHREVDALRRVIAEAGIEHLVHWAGYLPDDDLRFLHAGSCALVLPSAAEGFGLPAVEAAACGAPVIATRESPLPEILAGGGLFVTPGDEDELTVALEMLLDDPDRRSALARSAVEGASRLDWRRAAQAALAAVREAVA